jgi:hypothetical protein
MTLIVLMRVVSAVDNTSRLRAAAAAAAPVCFIELLEMGVIVAIRIFKAEKRLLYLLLLAGHVLAPAVSALAGYVFALVAHQSGKTPRITLTVKT